MAVIQDLYISNLRMLQGELEGKIAIVNYSIDNMPDARTDYAETIRAYGEVVVLLRDIVQRHIKATVLEQMGQAVREDKQ